MNRQTTIFILAMIALLPTWAKAQESGHLMPGVAIAVQSADLAAQKNGPLYELCVKEGDFVKKGTLLAALDYRRAKAEWEAAELAAQNSAAIELASIDVVESAEKIKRLQSAIASGASNQTELDIAINQWKRTQSKLKLERNSQKLAKKLATARKWEWEQYLVRAPFDGIVTNLHVKVGNQVELNAPIVTLIQPEQLDVELHLPLRWFGKLEKGKVYQLKASKPVVAPIPAKLIYVSHTIDSASQTFRCQFKIDNQTGKLPAGFSCVLDQAEVRVLTQSGGSGNEQSIAANDQ